MFVKKKKYKDARTPTTAKGREVGTNTGCWGGTVNTGSPICAISLHFKNPGGRQQSKKKCRHQGVSGIEKSQVSGLLHLSRQIRCLTPVPIERDEEGNGSLKTERSEEGAYFLEKEIAGSKKHKLLSPVP